jgi:Holliday junction DNA helicase RuvA
MIAYLKGIITELSLSGVVLEVGGIGYDIAMAYNLMTDLKKEDEAVKLYIYEHIKEDAHDLYGFITKEQKELFKQLIGVSGIGPKGAVQVLDYYTPVEVVEIILAEDSKALSKVSGIGAKTAQRIILELKNSIGKLTLQEERPLPIESAYQEDVKTEATEALVALGYSHHEATKAIRAIYDGADDVEKLIKKGLSLLMG